MKTQEKAVEEKERPTPLLEFANRLFMVPSQTERAIISMAPGFRISCELPEAEREILVKSGRDREERSQSRPLTIKTPPLTWSWDMGFMSPRPGDTRKKVPARIAHNAYYLFAHKRVGGKYYAVPYELANVHQSAAICWGNNSPKSLREANQTFWSAPFNSDLWRDRDRQYRNVHRDGRPCPVVHQCKSYGAGKRVDGCGHKCRHFLTAERKHKCKRFAQSLKYGKDYWEKGKHAPATSCLCSCCYWAKHYAYRPNNPVQSHCQCPAKTTCGDKDCKCCATGMKNCCEACHCCAYNCNCECKHAPSQFFIERVKEYRPKISPQNRNATRYNRMICGDRSVEVIGAFDAVFLSNNEELFEKIPEKFWKNNQIGKTPVVLGVAVRRQNDWHITVVSPDTKPEESFQFTLQKTSLKSKVEKLVWGECDDEHLPASYDEDDETEEHLKVEVQGKVVGVKAKRVPGTKKSKKTE